MFPNDNIIGICTLYVRKCIVIYSLIVLFCVSVEVVKPKRYENEEAHVDIVIGILILYCMEFLLDLLLLSS